MEHVITELAVEVAQKHTAIEGDVVVAPSDDLFWFHRPKVVLYLIHFILFQIAFEIAFFFWLLVRNTKHSVSNKFRKRYIAMNLLDDSNIAISLTIEI